VLSHITAEQFRASFVSEDPGRLAAFRKQHGLDRVVAPGKTELDQLHLLAAWTFGRLPSFGKPSVQTENSAVIIARAAEGHTFYCAHYALVMTTAALALGWEARLISQRKADYPDRVSNHNVVEVWWRIGRAWIMFDPTHVLHFTDPNGRPLNCHEVGREWFLNKGRDLRLVHGAEKTIHTVAAMPIMERHYPNYGWLQVAASTLDCFGCLAHVPTNRFLEDYPAKSVEHWDDWPGLYLYLGQEDGWRTPAAKLAPYACPAGPDRV
jgi:hypothetical protein